MLVYQMVSGWETLFVAAMARPAGVVPIFGREFTSKSFPKPENCSDVNPHILTYNDIKKNTMPSGYPLFVTY